MNAKLSNLSELANILSVKSEIRSNILALALIAFTILIPIGIYFWAFGEWYQHALGIGLITYGIAGAFTTSCGKK